MGTVHMKKKDQFLKLKGRQSNLDLHEFTFSIQCTLV